MNGLQAEHGSILTLLDLSRVKEEVVFYDFQLVVRKRLFPLTEDQSITHL